MNLARGWRLVALAAVGVAVSACGSPSDQESVDSSRPSSDNPASSGSPASQSGGGLNLHGKKNVVGSSSDGDGTGGDGSDGDAGGSDTSNGDSDASTGGGGGGDGSDAGSAGDTDAGSGGGSDTDAGGGGSDTDGGGSANDGGSQTGAPMLNLSSISCTDNGTVDVHFVLLFAGSATPGDLSGTYNGGSFGPVAPERETGNVWHYDVFLPAGDVDIQSAKVTADGQTVDLHNPDAYMDTYSCSAPPPACSVQVSAQDQICLDSPIGSETAECSFFGLSLIAKDTPAIASNTFSSTQTALLAIVKTGTGSCGPGMAAYRTYTDVTVGEVLSAPGGQNISHVTYCKCPDSL